MKNKLLFGVLFIFTTSVLTVLVVLFVWGSIREKELMREGANFVQRVEQFRHENGRLPKNLRETGLPESEEGPLYYEKRGDEHYVIFFSIGFDDLWGYYSDSKSWENYYRE